LASHSEAKGCTRERWRVVHILGSAGGGAAAFLLIYLVFIVLGIVAAVKVLTKTGYSGWWVLLMLIPFVGFVMLLVFAFADWPILKELRSYREAGRGPVSGGYPPPPMSSQPYSPYGPSGGQYPAPGAPSWPGSMPPPPPPPPPAPPVSGY
jgi:hypothetical protein